MRVVIGEDEALLRQGLALVLEQGGFDVVAAVPDAVQLLEAVDRHNPDLVVTDIRMPPTLTDEGLVAALRIRSAHPDTAVVVLSQYVQRRYAVELLTDRPAKVGYLLKQRISDVDTFCADLRRVAAGGTALDPDVVGVMVKRARLADGDVARLTPRQQEVMALMAEGRSNGWIASRLVVTEKAVVQHASRIYDALGLPVDADDHRRVLAVIRYLAQ
ncbi:response regulator [Glaciibacter superstes]|uniref:response regulator n=1 Tax=Glaciibacter superstes TaxID=501023 RepID=UPI0003B7A26D|nr:response regulator transcription factor [Glaciibacter superstes]